jgi:hypothetical protein
LTSTSTGGIALGNRAHLQVRPEFKEAFTRCFVDVLGCGAPATLTVAGWPEPILAYTFPNGGSISVEFAEHALDSDAARRGAWLEIRVDDVKAVVNKVVHAGLERVKHPATPTFYFVVPGGQVIGIVAATRV